MPSRLSEVLKCLHACTSIGSFYKPSSVTILFMACVTLGCFTNGTIAQVVTNSLSPLSGQHLYDGSRATV